MSIPDGIKYTNEHEWVKIDNDTAIIGVTDFAQSELGDIVFIEFPNIGDSFSQNDVFGTIEAVKTLADLYLPLSGKIISINNEIENTPELINEDPYNNGWLVKIKFNNLSEYDNLLSNTDYEKLIK